MKKLVIVINGSGGVGKDTLCQSLESKYLVRNRSSVDPIKEIATYGGWKGEKDDKARLLLVNLKRAFIDYNDLPLHYLLDQYEEFLSGEEEVFFVHIREPEEIDKFKNSLGSKICKTLLVTRDTNMNWDNSSDRDVNNYKYDYYFNNNLSKEEAAVSFQKLIEEMFSSVK